MPWSESDFPNSMKNLDPKIRKKAISIANAILENGGKEGTAIATGIKRAKGIYKVAGLKTNIAVGAGIGATLGYIRGSMSKDHSKKKKIIGAGVGGIFGGFTGRNFYHAKQMLNTFHPRPLDPNAFYKKYGVDSKLIKTKKDATKQFYELAKKHHPDMKTGSLEKMTELNKDWESFKSSSGFNKLGNYKLQIGIPVAAGLIAGGLLGYKKEKKSDALKGALAGASLSGLISGLSYRNHKIKLKQIQDINKYIDRELEKRSSEDKKRLLASGITGAGAGAAFYYASKDKINAMKYTNKLPLDYYDQIAKNKDIRKIKYMSALLPIVSIATTAGLLKLRKTLKAKKEEQL